MDRLNWAKQACFVFVLCATTAIAVRAQSFKVLFSFDGTDGAGPYAAPVQATNGYLYGTTSGGGDDGAGTVFKVDPNGTLVTIHLFCSQSGCEDGEGPVAGLVQATNGDFYGTTIEGGANGGNGACPLNCGTVFKITPSGTLTTFYNFCSQSGCEDGQYPQAALDQTNDGNFYGTTANGGAYGVCYLGSCGTVFKITPDGTLSTLHSFAGTDGANPFAALMQGTDGNFYGTTAYGGANYTCGTYGCGTVFKITPSGTLTTLHSFCSQSGCADGEYPYAGLVRASNGSLYGTTDGGGSNSCESGCGTIFEITPGGTFTTLYSFCSQIGCADGSEPGAGLIQATDGNLYGTTIEGGANDSCTNGCGTAFEITPSGKLTTLYNFCSRSTCKDGGSPLGTLIQDTDGKFYGATYSGGRPIGYGTLFSLSVGLGAFVETQPTSGPAGRLVKILGTNLTGATSVSFNGTAATFRVVSGSEITTTVPTGATSGKVQVVTPGGTLTSNVPFRVLP